MENPEECVVLIESFSDNMENRTGHGTGFHYGGGWIITNSHVVGKDAENLRHCTIKFLLNGEQIQLSARRRRSFQKITHTLEGHDQIHHVGDLDIAIFMLDDDEKKPGSTTVVIKDLPDVKKDSRTVCYHYGNGITLQRSNEVVTEVTEDCFLRKDGNTTDGSSGSPVFLEDGGLVGVHFADTHGGLGVAFHFSIVRKLLNDLISSISNVNHLIGLWFLHKDKEIENEILKNHIENSKLLLEITTGEELDKIEVHPDF